MRNGSVFELIEMYHQHVAMGLVSPLYLFFGETFEILMDSIDMEVVSSGWLGVADE
jgi:hypothetical protein